MQKRSAEDRIVVRDTAGGWRLFEGPERVLAAYRPVDVMPVLREADRAVARGRHVAGFLSYEAAPGLDDALSTHALRGFPLAWFGVFRRCRRWKGSVLGAPGDAVTKARPGAVRWEEGEGFRVGGWRAVESKAEYGSAIRRIRKYLRDGDTYQVNYTIRLRARFEGSPWALFARLFENQDTGFCGFVETGEWAVCSASPELFFRLQGTDLVSRPMKGTSPRGLSAEEDERLAASLAASGKDRAENVMIVDMIRNDMGRIGVPGTVRVRSLFDVERYPTVLQMTSTVGCRTRAPVSEIFRAMFPCASVTGAPKVRTMEIIRELEPHPRGVYTGCVGYMSPGRQAQFNVAIRTVVVHKSNGTAEYGVGSGIVWDSRGAAEYEECRVKAAVLTARRPRFELLETLLWRRKRGFYLLKGHLRRLERSARYFGFRVDAGRTRERLLRFAAALERRKAGRQRVRLLVDEDGGIRIEARAHGAWRMAHGAGDRPHNGQHSTQGSGRGERGVWRVALAKKAVRSGDAFLCHKTTNRRVYEQARAAAPGYDDVILWNEKGEVTESTVANVVVEKRGRLVTPPVSCGLLGGVYREHLLARGKVVEGRITKGDLLRAKKAFLVNSVRGWIRVELRQGPRGSLA